jgi:hypothetical protein
LLDPATLFICSAMFICSAICGAKAGSALAMSAGGLIGKRWRGSQTTAPRNAGLLVQQW